MRIVLDEARSPRLNMAIDRMLLEDDGPLTLRLYRWRPAALSLGWFQTLDDDLRRRLESRGADVVRRLTGGGAIFHDDEITYALTGREGEPPFVGDVGHSYRVVHDALRTLFRDRGVALDYASNAPAALRRHEQPFYCYARCTRLDLATASGKIVGSAKRRRHGRALQHGSILMRGHELNPGSSGVLDEGGDAHELSAAIVRCVAVAVAGTGKSAAIKNAIEINADVEERPLADNELRRAESLADAPVAPITRRHRRRSS